MTFGCQIESNSINCEFTFLISGDKFKLNLAALAEDALKRLLRASSSVFGARDTFDYFELKRNSPNFRRTNNAFGTKRTRRRYKMAEGRATKSGKQRNAFSEAKKVSIPPKDGTWPFRVCRRWWICPKADSVLKYSDVRLRRSLRLQFLIHSEEREPALTESG